MPYSRNGQTAISSGFSTFDRRGLYAAAGASSRTAFPSTVLSSIGSSGHADFIRANNARCAGVVTASGSSHSRAVMSRSPATVGMSFTTPDQNVSIACVGSNTIRPASSRLNRVSKYRSTDSAMGSNCCFANAGSAE